MTSPVKSVLLLLLLIAGIPAPAGLSAADPGTQEEAGKEHRGKLAFFESEIRPQLVKHCYRCHGPEVQKGGLRVDLRDALRRGGHSGSAVVPRSPDSSLLLKAIAHQSPELQMPPRKPKLSSKVLADVRQWIEDGAVDPRTPGKASPGRPTARDQGDGEEHWAYLQRSNPEFPHSQTDDWSEDPVDRFVLRGLDREGLHPSEDAPPGVLIRRISFDLIGLPPTEQELIRFTTDHRERGSRAAMAAAVDRLLQSEQFGVRWGRHWLDVVRFGESSGGESNISFPHAWRYRDYVIDAFNEDLPFDRFLIEQVAGDLLDHKDVSQRERLLIATGFLAVGTKSLGENDLKRFEADLIDEQIDSLTRSLLGSSVACARCHDHKFDPFSMRDYYALAGIFGSTRTYFGTSTSPANIRSGDPLVLPRREGQRIYHQSFSKRKMEELKSQFETLDRERKAIRESQAAMWSGKKPERVFTLREVLANTWRIGGVEGKLETVDAEGRALPLAMGVQDREQPTDSPLYEFGDVRQPGQRVPRGFPQALGLTDSHVPSENQSGRLELARWMADPRHPLTARVYVNRVWSHLFGRGLVSTVDDFGTTGAPPSHPELLDHLASEFIRDGWSTKRLLRRLMLTRVYRQSSSFSSNAFEQDPENRWIWRMPKRRLEAEAIRDAMLSVCGQLDVSRADGSLVATDIGDRPISLIGLNEKLPKDLDGATYRSAYLPVIRDRLPPVLELFDFAEPSLVTGQRENTNVPLQALYLMNSEFVYSRAKALAHRCFETRSAGAEATQVDRDSVAHAFRLCFARAPEASELERSLDFLRNEEEFVGKQDARVSFCQGLLSTAEFRNLD